MATLASPRSGNLPADVTSFVGRRYELAEMRDALRQQRLVTVTGVGGVGKTRLALKVASEVHRAFHDGAWFVELAGLRDGVLLGDSVAAALGFQDQSTGWSSSTLCDLIGERRMLIVLDNCEHLVNACAVLADSLLKMCPELRILTTSRQPLHITGERVLEIGPLPAPPPTGSMSTAEVSASDAVTLFLDRAEATQPGFHLDDGNAHVIADICRRLDGIPLALELAAGRLRTLSVQQLSARLDARFDVLVGGSRAALPRQQTLRALIGWSYDLCTSREQLLWERVSIFRDGFSLECVEDVCTDTDLPRSSALDTVEGLVEKSVCRVTRGEREHRYRMPETLRQYGSARLALRGDTLALQRRHRDWCADLVRAFTRDWFGPNQDTLLQGVRAEHENLASALDFCFSNPADVTAGEQIAAGLRYFWTTSGRLGEGRLWLERFLALDHGGRGATPGRVTALCVAADLIGGHASSAAVVDRMLEEADTLADELRDEGRGKALVAQVRGEVLQLRGELEASIDELQRAADLHREGGDVGARAFDLALLGIAKCTLGQQDATVALDECVSLCTTAGESWTRAAALWASGVEAFKVGDLAASFAAQSESLRLRVPLDARYLMPLNLDAFAWLAVVQNDHARGARLFGAADAIVRDMGGSLMLRGLTSKLHHDHLSIAKGALAASEFTRAFDEGIRMPLANAIAYALNATSTPLLIAPPTADTRGGVLTRREIEVAKLVARGLTNKQISATLVISLRTAEGHVEHILSKLGLNTRTQIAMCMTEVDGGRHPPTLGADDGTT